MAEAVTITQEQMARFMDALGFDEADPGHPCGEVCYEAPYGTQGCRLRVYSTIANDGASRGVGADAIRVVCVDPEGDVFLKPFKRVHRVVNWRRNLLSRIDPVFADPSGYRWAEPMDCDRCGSVVKMRVGRNGPFMGCTAFPKCRRAFPVPEVGA